ncbi:MAG: hypothetical protein ACXWJM_10105 [Ramlibacter sp.]
MIPYEVDPSLHNADPEPEQLGDGFSPPQRHHAPVRAEVGAVSADEPPDPSLAAKSLF